ncbi:MAG: hypothetical protein ACLQOO_35275 [Terriglobia bacterium]
MSPTPTTHLNHPSASFRTATLSGFQTCKESSSDLNRGYHELLVKLYGPRVEFESVLRESKQSAMDLGATIIRGLLGAHIRAKGGKVGEEIK